MAADRVTANSRNRRPTMPPIKRMGMNTATREKLMERTVKPISFEPSRAACLGGDPLLHVAGDVLEHDDRVIDHEPRRNGQRHEGEVVQVVAEEVHDAEGADKGDRDGDGRDDGGADIPQEGEDHQDHEAEGDQKADLDIPEGAADRRRPVLDDGEIDRRPAGPPGAGGGRSPTRSTVSMILAFGWRKMTTMTAGFPLTSPPPAGPRPSPARLPHRGAAPARRTGSSR